MLTSSAASRVQANLHELFEENVSPGNAHIKFQLTPAIMAFLSMKQVQESLIVEAGQITPLPSMPEYTIGMMNSRDRVFCLFDLAQLLTLPSALIAPRQYQIMVLQTTGESPIQIGLAVINLQGITRFTPEQILPSTNVVDSSLTPYISGVVQQNETTIPILQFERILATLKTVQTTTR